MTNIEVGLIVASALTSASASVGFYMLHRQAFQHAEFLKRWLHDIETAKQIADSVLQAGIKGETKALHDKVVAESDRLEQAMHARLDSVVQYLDFHAEVLKSNAEDLRNHAKSIHDEAQASKNSVTRVVPQR